MKLLNFVLSHPCNRGERVRPMWRVIRWQLISRLVGNGWVLWPWVNSSVLVAAKGRHGATGNIYCGLHEFEEMCLVAHLLRPGEEFLDVGSNIGSYSVLAASVGARSVAVEPHPETAKVLRMNSLLNGGAERIQVIEAACSDTQGLSTLTANLDTTNHIQDGSKNGVTVTTLTVDEIAISPIGMKIDVEGYEAKVLRGAKRVLALGSIEFVVVEVNQDSFDEVFFLLYSSGFTQARYDPVRRSLETASLSIGSGNAIFVKSIEDMNRRASSAPGVSVFGQTY